MRANHERLSPDESSNEWVTDDSTELPKLEYRLLAGILSLSVATLRNARGKVWLDRTVEHIIGDGGKRVHVIRAQESNFNVRHDAVIRV